MVNFFFPFVVTMQNASLLQGAHGATRARIVSAAKMVVIARRQA
jgi:hypothetical protein